MIMFLLIQSDSMRRLKLEFQDRSVAVALESRAMAAGAAAGCAPAAAFARVRLAAALLHRKCRTARRRAAPQLSAAARRRSKEQRQDRSGDRVSSIDEKSKPCVVVLSRACKCVSALKETNEDPRVLECPPQEHEGLKTKRILS